MVVKTRQPKKPVDPPAFPDTFQARLVRPNIVTADNGRETDRERISKLEALLEKMQTDLDIQMRRTAALQAQLDVFIAKQSR
jgi:hypothetical protein